MGLLFAYGNMIRYDPTLVDQTSHFFALCTNVISYHAFSSRFQNCELLFIITQPSIYGVIVYFLLCHESLNYSIGQKIRLLTGTIPWPGYPLPC